MRTLAIAMCLPVLAIAQTRSGYPRAAPPPFVQRPAGALGGNFGTMGSSRPLGGVELPGAGIRAAQAQFQPPPLVPRTGYGYGGYVGPVYYTPNAADLESIYSEATSHLGGGAYHPAYPPPPIQPLTHAAGSGIQFGSAPQPPQTVIVNNYYGKDSAPPTAGVSTPPEMPSDYYLIAYKNRNVIAALAYWLDGDTLHYVTAEKAHNQASLALIDLEMTKRLNADHEVPFTVPNK